MEEKYKVSICYKSNKSFTAYIEKNKNLLDILRENKIPIDSHCNGKGSCGKCKVQVKNKLLEPTILDEKHLSKDELYNGYRLACNLNIKENLEIIVPNNKVEMKVLTSSTNGDLDIYPIVQKKYIKLEKPKLSDQRSDHNRLSDSLGIEDLNIDIKHLSKINDILEKENYEITCTTYKNKLLHLEGKNKVDSNYGLAVDIGTTTIAMYILNLNTGEEIDVVSQVNNQRSYGSDVISRINFTMENENGLSILQDSIINQLNNMIDILCENNNINSDNIYNAVIVGNTTIIHLLLGLSCKNIALAPYIPITTKEFEFEAKEIGVNINGIINIMPGIASYVGSDITSGILSSNILKSDKYSLLLDLGTNGEMVLGNKNEVITCSTAAGPAFEGANIKYGIGGVKGAICKIKLSENKIYETIGNIKPSGICGSGVLDIVGELVKYEIVDETGRMVDKCEIEDLNLRERLVNVDNMKQFILESNLENEGIISFTQKDVREVQLAKAAICAGINILLEERSLDVNEIENVYIGGGFGNYMDINSCVIIGMIPKELKEKIKSIGNCAGSGAKMYLLSRNMRNMTEEIINKSTYIELSQRKGFQECFIDCMMMEYA